MAITSSLPKLKALAPLAKVGGMRVAKKVRNGPDRRRSKRITLEELNKFGAAALEKHRAEITRPTDRRPGYMKVLDIIDVPRNLIANVLGTLAGVDKSKKERATLGIPRVSFSDLLGKLGMKKGPARSVAGLVGDIAIDPLTYYSYGSTAGLKIAQHLPRILKAGKVALKAAAVGKMAPKLAKALRLRKPFERTLARFTQMAKKRGIRDVPKYLMGKRGGLLTKRLVRMAEEGHKPTLRWLQQFGEKGRSLFRIPGMDVGEPILKFGARARKAKAVTAGLTEGGQALFQEMAALRKAVNVGKVAQASRLAYEAATKGDLKTAAAQIKLLRPKLAQLQKKYSLLLSARKSARVKGVPVPPTKRVTFQTPQMRKIGRELASAEELVRRTQERLAQAKIPGQLAGKFEVTPGGLAALERAAARPPKGALKAAYKAQAVQRVEMKAAGKLAPTRTVYPPGMQARRVPMHLTKQELSAATQAQKRLRPQMKAATAGREAAEQALTTAKQERMLFATSPKAPGVIQEKMRVALGPRYLRGTQKGILPKLHQLRRTWFGAPRGTVKQRMVGIEAQYGPRAGGMGARMTAATAREIEPLIARLATDPKVLAQFPGGADEIRRVLQALAQKGRFAEGEALQGIFMRAQRAGIVDAAGEIADPKLAAALAKAAPGGFVSHMLTPEAREAIARHGKMTAEREGKTRPMRLTAPRPEAIARTKAIHLRGPDGTIRKMLDTPEKAAEIAELKAEGYQVVGRFDISAAEWNRMAASEGGLSQLTGPQYEGLKKFKGPLFEEDLAKTAGQRVARGVQTDAANQFVDLVSPFGVDVPHGAQDLEKYAHLAPVNRPVEGNPFKVLEQTGIFNRQYPVQVADQINDMIRVYDQPEVIKSLLHYTDMGLGIWKSFQLYHPAYFIRNVWQNFFGGIMAGARPSVVARLGWGREGRLLRKALDLGDPNILGDATILLKGRQTPLRELYDDALRYHLTGGGRTAQQMPVKFAGEAGTVAAAKALEQGRKKVSTAVFRINSWFEDTQKLGTWMNFIDDGMDAQSAALRTLTAMPDLSDLTRFEKGTMRRLIPFWCVPDDHRILTREGWKTVDELEVDDLVLTYNVEKDISEWQPVKAVNTFDYDGTILNLKTKLAHFQFTPEHRWPVWHNTTKNGKDVSDQRKIVKGYRLNSSHRIPKTAPHSFSHGNASVSKREAALIGWLFTDGHLRLRRGKYWEAVIYQKKEQHLAGIRKLLGDDARAEYVHPQTGVIRFSMSADLTRRLVSLCDGPHGMPSFVTSLTEANAKVMYQAMIDAEASVHERAGTCFSQKPGPVLEAFQILCLMLGKTADIGKSSTKNVCHAYVSKARRWMKVAGALGHEHYKGRVWCPTTENGTWFMERDGRVIISGNSWMRKNGALQIMHFLPRKPAYANLMPKLKEFAEGFRGKDNVPEELRAEWMREQMAWQVAGTAEEGTAFLPSTWFPFEELYAAGTMAVQPGEGLRRLYTGMRPEIRFGAELATGYSAFRKQEYPLGSDITTGQLAKAVPKAIMGKSGTQMDVLLGLRPAREWLPGGRVSEMKGLQAQAQRTVLGGALQPMDAERGRRARYYELSKEIQTVRAQINRALQAGDQSLAENLQRKWMRLMVEMQRLGLPVPKATGAMMERLAVPAGMGQ